jgi:dihydrodipicolinate synthase/N-acetylneuraminate lyase
MNRDSVAWHGPMPALVTPFGADRAIDRELLARNIELQLEHGATGFLVGGCTGEFWAMSLGERAALFRMAVEIVAGRATVLAGSGAIQVREAIELTLAAKAARCDGAVIVPPYFVKLTDDEIFGHYEAISRDVGFPICLYNIPGNAVNALSPNLARRLADLECVVAIKESSGDWNNYYATAMQVGDLLRVFCGPSSVFGVAAVLLGADGAIDCFPNMWLPGGIELYYAARDGRLDAARRLQATGVRLTALLTSEGRTLYPATKAAMNMLGLPGGLPRPPLRPLGATQLAGLRQGLAELGLLGGSSITATAAQ